MFGLIGIVESYEAMTGLRFLSLFFASPDRPVVWEPLDPAKYEDNVPGFLDGLEAYNREDFAEALKVWTPLAEAGDVDSQLLLGYMHSFGFGVNRAPEIAFRWYKAAADQGSPRGMANLGVSYARGKGVPENKVQAAKLYRQAAELGDRNGMYGLARALFRGEGVGKNMTEAMLWAELAIKAGNCEIHQLLAAINWNPPSGSESDYEKTYYHALMARKLGCPHEELETFSRFLLTLEDRHRVETKLKMVKN